MKSKSSAHAVFMEELELVLTAKLSVFSALKALTYILEKKSSVCYNPERPIYAFILVAY